MSRPAHSDPAQVWTSLPRATIDRIDHLVIDLHMSRAEVIALLIEAGFERIAKKREED